ncbi:MAG TPA: hypothetical protein VMG30_08080 [Acidobacteriota bacterium]|nr:hypothetical protein [Acidobacteriota bacterium]
MRQRDGAGAQIAGRSVILVLLLTATVRILPAAELQKGTVLAWDRYLQWAQQKVTRELSNPNVFLIQNTLLPKERSEIWQKLTRGEVFVEQMPSVVPQGIPFEVPSGEIHHWWGAILLRNVTLEHVMHFLQDYDHHAGKFSDVERSRLISKNGDQYRFYFRLRRSKAFVTAYYNTEQECTYTYHGANRISSQSEAVKIAELEDADTPSEKEKQPGNDRGFLWRLASWWRFEQRGPDTVIELESASLSRDIPALIKFMPGVSHYIRSTPKESLESVLTSIRENVK